MEVSAFHPQSRDDLVEKIKEIVGDNYRGAGVLADRLEGDAHLRGVRYGDDWSGIFALYDQQEWAYVVDDAEARAAEYEEAYWEGYEQ